MSIRRLRPLWLLTPQLLLTGLLIFGILQGVMQSFGIIPSLGLTTWTLDYYRQALSHSQFWTSLGFSLQLAFFSSIISMGLGLLICYLMLSSQEKTLYVERLIRIPIIVPHIVVALFVLLIFSRTGLLARLLYALGFEQAQQWMGGLTYDPHGIGINLAYVWKETPFIVFFCYPGLRSVSRHLGEAGRTLGAGPVKTFLRVTLPMCRGTVTSAFLIIFMYAFGAYELPKLLGPTLPLSLPELAYTAYIHPDMRTRPLAMAYNGILALVGLVCAVLYFMTISKRQELEGEA